MYVILAKAGWIWTGIVALALTIALLRKRKPAGP
jgi:hypothetical protein